MTCVDALGTAHAPVSPGQPVRIVSLVPSITELLCDLGLADVLVGRTGFCIHPADTVKRIAKVGGTKDINRSKVLALAPTHLIVNIDENPKDSVALLAQEIEHVVVTHPQAPRDNLALYRLLGAIFRRSAEAEKLCQAFEQAFAQTAAACRGRPPQRVLYCIWKDPWMTVSRDTYIAGMLAQMNFQQWQAVPIAGLPPSAASAPARYPVFDWSEAGIDALDLVLLSSEPYNFTAADAAQLQQRIGTPVRLVDGEMMSWYGSRAIAAMQYLEQLAASVGPERS